MSDLSSQRQAGETEITAAMEDAGIEAYLNYCPDSGIGDATDRKMVREIFAEMLSHRPDRSKEAQGDLAPSDTLKRALKMPPHHHAPSTAKPKTRPASKGRVHKGKARS